MGTTGRVHAVDMLARRAREQGSGAGGRVGAVQEPTGTAARVMGIGLEPESPNTLPTRRNRNAPTAMDTTDRVIGRVDYDTQAEPAREPEYVVEMERSLEAP